MVSSSDDVLDVIREQRRAYEPFTPLTDDEVKRAVQAIQDAIGEWGSDRLHAQWARLVLDNTERNVRAVAAGAGDPITCPHGKPLRPEGCPDCLHDAIARAAGDRPPAPRKEPWEPTDPWQVIQRAPAIWDVVRMRGEEWDSCCGFPLGGLARDVCSALNKAERAVRPPPRAAREEKP